MENFTEDEHILVCLSSSPSNARIIRAAQKMAQAFNAKFTALFVETPAFSSMSDEDRERLRQNLKFAEKSGASIETVYGEDVAYQIARFARLSAVSKIVLGRSVVKKRRFFKKPVLTDRLIELAPNLDIYIIPDFPTAQYRQPEKKPDLRISLRDIGLSILILCLATLIDLLFWNCGYLESNIITVYILGVLIISVVTNSRLCGIIASVLSVLIFNFFFTVPRYTFLAYDSSYPLTFAVMLVSALISGGLAAKLKQHAAKSALTAHRTKLLFDTNQLLQRAHSQEEIIALTAGQLRELLKKDLVFFSIKDNAAANGRFFPANGDAPRKAVPVPPSVIGELTEKLGSGLRPESFSAQGWTYYPVNSGDKVMALSGVYYGKEHPDAFDESLITAVLGECALSLQNEKNAREKRESELLAENERLRANLLRSISHDLRTPLTSISGNASNLLSNADNFDKATRQQIYADIYEDSMWLINLVENLLAVTRLEDGRMNLRLSSELLEDIVCEAVSRMDNKRCGHEIKVTMPDDFIIIQADAKLMVQVIINLIDNAVKHTPAGTLIEVEAEKRENCAVLMIRDNGNGISDSDKAHIFDMFFTGDSKAADSRRSLGLGLSLCKSIVEAHKGEISVADNQPHGTVFTVSLPVGEVEIHE